LVDYTSRLFRGERKARVSKSVAQILDRLNTNAEFWGALVTKMLTSTLRGTSFSSSHLPINRQVISTQ